MIISFGSHKGGVGKSTLACNIASILANAGHSVKILDSDENGTSATWCETRKERDVPIIDYVVNAGESKLLNNITAFSKIYDFLIVDVRGVKDARNETIYQMSDKVIFPFSPSILDLNTLPQIENYLERQKALFEQGAFTKPRDHHFVLTRIPTNNKKEEMEAVQFFKDFDIPLCKTRIHDRKIFRDSMNLGLGVIESKDAKAKKEMEDLVTEILSTVIKAVRQKPSNVPKNKPKSDKGASL